VEPYHLACSRHAPDLGQRGVGEGTVQAALAGTAAERIPEAFSVSTG